MSLVPDFTPSSEGIDWLSGTAVPSDSSDATAWRRDGMVGVVGVAG
jgi:hypothetical protein